MCLAYKFQTMIIVCPPAHNRKEEFSIDFFLSQNFLSNLVKGRNWPQGSQLDLNGFLGQLLKMKFEKIYMNIKFVLFYIYGYNDWRCNGNFTITIYKIEYIF